METFNRPLKDFDANQEKTKLTQCAIRARLWIVREKSELGDSFMNVLFRGGRATEKENRASAFLFFVLASDRLIAALHKPAGTSCREKVANENVNACDAKRNTTSSDIVRRRRRPNSRRFSWRCTAALPHDRLSRRAFSAA
jgi:hypothetical protein